jgi:L-lactate dehydrogenase
VRLTLIFVVARQSVSQDSNLVIITAGAAQKAGESRLNLLERNVGIMKSIVPKVLTFSPNAAICIVANPVDIITAVAAKIAGPSIPAGRVFGSGTCLDSSRLISLISKKLDLDASAVSGFVIGEHGDSSVPVWSSVRAGGVPLLGEGQEPTILHERMHKEVVDSAYEVIKKKGYTNWAVGLTGAHIARAVLYDTRQVMPLSTCVRGIYGIEEDIFTSVPCTVGSTGIRRLVKIPLTDSEQAKLQKSAETLWGMQKDIWDKI